MESTVTNGSTPPPAAAITVTELRVVRGGNRILDDISIEIPAGTVYGLVGPSGSGKTTLIRAIAGRQRIAGGSVLVGGIPAGSPILRERIGYMPQDTAVYTDLTGRENLQFFGAINRVTQTRISDVIDLLDMRSAIDRPLQTYSGGQRQRIALGIALLSEPPVLLLDEPTVGLDPGLRRRLWQGFAEWARAGTTLLVSTHVMDEAARADRLAFLSDGRVVADGAPAELLARTGRSDLESAMLALTAPGVS